jgi:DNA polymerase I-like protein with 3'-5' exonuclease and polymerase domains
MVLNHVLFNYLPKDLAFLASIYCPRYKYWKDEITADKETPEVRWKYNVKDICWTREILEAQLTILEKRPEKQKEFYSFQQREISPCLQEMMYIGTRVDIKKKHNLHKQLETILYQIEANINELFSYSIAEMEVNLKSPKQIGLLFVDLLKIKPIIDKKRKTVTFGSDAMLIYREQYPQYYPLITLILEYRSIGIFVRTFLGAELDEDGRLRTAYGVAGTKSYRLSSRKNAFGKGLNMANIPSKGKIALNYSLDLSNVDNESDLEDIEDIGLIEEESITKLPNCKEIFLPDVGTVFWNADYSGADAMVVAWDSNCEFLINFFSTSKEKLYIYVVREYLQQEITAEHPFYKKAKQFIHLTNYGGMEAKAAASSGLDIITARNLRNWYFGKCPEILDWHKRIASEVASKGYIENIFGARFYLLDKNCPTLLNQAYALIPQSTIAILINKGIVNIFRNETDLVFGKAANTNGTRNSIIPLMQIHDAASGIFVDRSDKENDQTLGRIIKHLEIALPYKKPLIIPADGSWSRNSYGECK